VAAATLKKLGFADVANMTGGFTAWKDAGLPSVDHHAGFSGDSAPVSDRKWPTTRGEGQVGLDTTAVVLVMAAIVIWAAVSARLERADLTAPIVFTAYGAALAGLGLVNGPSSPETLKPLVEVTLVWVLFTDAARVRVPDLRDDAGRFVRLLGVGLPLTVLAGWGLASWLFPDLGVWLALLVAAALAPTDAALGVPVVTNPVVPSRIRRLITVESGLNDGIATPVVMLAIAGAASAAGFAGAEGPGKALVELAVGVAVGVAVGFIGGWLLRWTRRRGWAAEDFVGVAVLALALAAYASALTLHGNGFVAAFCGGLAFGAAAGPRGPSEVVFLEQASGLVSLLVWLGFGAIAVPMIIDRVSMSIVAYAVLSLTLVRMVPVALASIGAGLDRQTVLFVGWFGPRGLASLVFALLALEELGEAQMEEAVVIIALTVFLSVLAHGASAAPLASRYGAAASTRGPEPSGSVPDVPIRGLPRRGGGRAAHNHDP
jgi:NhaP-type Na+/H+ or K+/H+ antiporter